MLGRILVALESGPLRGIRRSLSLHLVHFLALRSGFSAVVRDRDELGTCSKDFVFNGQSGR